MRLRIAEIGEHAVAHVSRDDALIAPDDLGDAGVIGAPSPAACLPDPSRAERAVEPTRSQNITVSWRRSASIPPHWFGRLFLPAAARASIEFRDGAQHLAAMPEQDAEILEILLGQIADNREIDRILGEALGVLSQIDRC